jgi:hypothetical protein
MASDLTPREALAWAALAATLAYRLGWVFASHRITAYVQQRPSGLWAKAKAWREMRSATADAKIVTPEEFADIVAKARGDKAAEDAKQAKPDGYM